MTLTCHELKQGRLSLLIWTASIGFLLAVCIFLYPEMKEDMDSISDMFASMGSFSAAFGMDQIDFGTLPGFYAVECGNILGLGGAFYAALCSISILSKEEKDHTAEFLLTQPVSRIRLVLEKLAAVFLQLILMNLVLFALAAISIAAIGEALPIRELILLHGAFLFLQLELAAICFGISAFIRRGGLGIGLGIAAILYFLNLIANIAKSAEFLRFITPFAYADGADILASHSLDAGLLALGFTYGALGIAVACIKYCRKDIR